MQAAPRPDSTLRPLKSVFTILHLVAFAVIYQVAPDPYIDEIFHVPQAQAYCRGDWLHWNNKITTPPGLYLVSSAIYKLGALIPVPFNLLCSTLALRALNLFIVVFIAPRLTRSLYRQIHPAASEDALLFAELLPAFPLLSFFGNLYYTDVLSTTAILWSYLLALKRQYVSSALVGGFSVLTRQTNIIWVAFVMAVSIVRELKQVDIIEGKEAPNSPPRSWLMFDPLAVEASFPVDYVIAVQQTVRGIVKHYTTALPIICCYGPVFAGFGVFLLWNRGIVLGDKSNHIAGINIPQILYCSTFIAAFAFPILLSPGLISTFLQSIFSTPRRLLKALALSLVLFITIRYNTIEHPFLRSDNRHFVFYIWRRTIKAHPLARYLAIPLYYSSSFAVLASLSYSQSALFLLGIVSCTALTIIPSPLLEFRYFVLPYFFWRLHLGPGVVEKSRWRGVLESVWFEAVNAVALWLFVTRPFSWDSEPGKVQRFIW